MFSKRLSESEFGVQGAAGLRQLVPLRLRGVPDLVRLSTAARGASSFFLFVGGEGGGSLLGVGCKGRPKESIGGRLFFFFLF